MFGLLAEGVPGHREWIGRSQFDLTDQVPTTTQQGPLLSTKGKELRVTAAVSPTGASLDC